MERVNSVLSEDELTSRPWKMGRRKREEGRRGREEERGGGGTFANLDKHVCSL